MSGKNKRKVAVFDVDGTIFRSSLLIEMTEAMIQSGVIDQKAGKIYTGAYKKWLDRIGHYDDYIMAVIDAFEDNIAGIKESDFIRVAKQVAAFHSNRVYRHTRDLVADLKKKGYYLMAISNSPKIILDEFCSRLDFDKVYGRIYEVDKRGRLTGETLYLDLAQDKAKMLQTAVDRHDLTLKGSVGVGDTESDVPFLDMVDRPICFNPNKRLYDIAKRKGWTIVIERKDVIHKIN